MRPKGEVDRTPCIICLVVLSINDLDSCVSCETDTLCADCMLAHDCAALRHANFCRSVEIDSPFSIDVMYSQYGSMLFAW